MTLRPSDLARLKRRIASTGKRRQRPESEIQRAILEALRNAGIPCWRNNSRVMRLPGKGGRDRLVRFGGMRGASDILGVIQPHGTMLAIEVKRPGRPATPEQLLFLQMVARSGGRSGVATTVEEALVIARGERR